MSTVRRLFLRYKEAWHDRKSVKITFFCTFVILTALLAFLLACLSNGESSRFFLWYDVPNDTFMDFFNSVRDARYQNPYTERGVIYPPLANLFYRLFGHYAPKWFEGEAFLYRQSQEALMLFFLYMSLASLLFFASVAALAKENRARTLLACVLFFSCPFIYLFERGNLLFVTLSCLMLFLAWYDSDDPWLREIALILLAVAVNLKIYPIVFGLLLLDKKHIKQALRCICYGAILFFVPMMFFGGAEGMTALIDGIAKTSKKFSMDTYSKVDFGNMWIFLASQTGWTGLKNIARFSLPIGAAVCGFCFFACPQKWQKHLALSLFCSFFASFGFCYVLVYLAIPLIAFFREPLDRKLDAVYLVLLTLPFIYVPFSLSVRYGFLLHFLLAAPRHWEQTCTLAMLALTCLLLGEAVAACARRRAAVPSGGGEDTPAGSSDSPDETGADGASDT